MGSISEVPQQYLNSCGIPGYESQTVLAVWLQIGDSLLYHYGTPLTLKYPTADTYLDHGNDMRFRMEKENPMSEFSRIIWSRNDIYKKPARNEQTIGGQPIQQVFLMNQQQTGMSTVTQREFSSITLGSFQTKMIHSYGTHLRRKEVETQLWVNTNTNDQRLSAMPNPICYMWEENHPPAGPPGWDPVLYWPREDVRMLLTFIPSRMRTVPDRAVVIMYKPVHQPPPIMNPLGLRPASLQRLICWCCGPSKPNACPIGERLVGCCSHVSTALSFATVVPMDPTAFSTTHKVVHLLDRKNQLQIDICTVSEVS